MTNRIKVKIHPMLQRLAGCASTVEVVGDTVNDCLRQLATRFPDLGDKLFNSQGDWRGQIDIFVNGVCLFPETMDKVVGDGDEILLIAIFGGG